LTCEDLRVVLPPDEPADAGARSGIVLVARDRVAYDDAGEGLRARCHELHYDEATGVATLTGTPDARAEIAREVAAAEPGGPAYTVVVSGPELLLDARSSVLDAPQDGGVTLIEHAGTEGADFAERRVDASAAGPLRYGENLLQLRDDVVISFSEDGVETRALWSDVATVHFVEAEDGPSGLDKLVASGRVHIEQTSPRVLVGEGDEAVWIARPGEEFIELRGTRPSCWAESREAEQVVRQTADWIRVFLDRDAVTTGPGNAVLVQDRR
jgi:hypothetical protein